MNQKIRQSWIILGGAAMYYFLFWQAPPGLNTLVFSLFLLMILGFYKSEKLSSITALVAMSGTVLSALLVVWHNSFLTKFSHIFSILLLIGFLQKAELRFIGQALLLSMLSFLEGPRKLFSSLTSLHSKSGQSGEVFRWLKLTLVPLLFGSLFISIYYYANAPFAAMIDRFLDALTFSLQYDFSVYLTKGLFFLTGALILSAFLLPTAYSKLFQVLPFQLKRTRSKNLFNLNPGTIALKNEYRIGLITMGLLNGILFLVNITDLRFIWIEYEDTSPQMLSQYVHEGTYLLIFAILLAMIVLLYFFRKNLNFYPENGTLKQLAYLWVIQNSVLAFSVGMRNFHYINEYGLAYKRLGIIWFLLLTITGLFSMHQKVKSKKNLNYLLYVNGWAFYASLILFGLINWDVAITRYNLSKADKNGIDVYFLTEEISDKNLYLLLENELLLKEKGQLPNEINQLLKDKQNDFTKKMESKNWRSWNWSDKRNSRYLQKKGASMLSNY